MKIVAPGIGPTPSARPARETRRSAAGGFARELPPNGDGVTAPRTISGSTFVPGVDLLLALHDEDDGARRRRLVISRGEALLDRLDGLRVALLAGRLSLPEIEALAEAVSKRLQDCDDPALASILADIELRAAVEIAKLQQPIDCNNI